MEIEFPPLVDPKFDYDSVEPLPGRVVKEGLTFINFWWVILIIFIILVPPIALAWIHIGKPLC